MSIITNIKPGQIYICKSNTNCFSTYYLIINDTTYKYSPYLDTINNGIICILDITLNSAFNLIKYPYEIYLYQDIKAKSRLQLILENE